MSEHATIVLQPSLLIADHARPIHFVNHVSGGMRAAEMVKSKLLHIVEKSMIEQ